MLTTQAESIACGFPSLRFPLFTSGAFYRCNTFLSSFRVFGNPIKCSPFHLTPGVLYVSRRTTAIHHVHFTNQKSNLPDFPATLVSCQIGVVLVRTIECRGCVTSPTGALEKSKYSPLIIVNDLCMVVIILIPSYKN